MHAKPDLRVFLKWVIAGSGSVIMDVMSLKEMFLDFTPTANSWRYFGRTAGGPTVFEVYRIPANGKSLNEQDLSLYPQRLLRDGTWIYDRNYTPILDEQYNGNFDEINDELNSDVVETLFNEWALYRWPGR